MEKYRAVVIPATITTSSITPSEKLVCETSLRLGDKPLRPICFRCGIVRDPNKVDSHSSVIRSRGPSPESVLQQMKNLGFFGFWDLRMI